MFSEGTASDSKRTGCSSCGYAFGRTEPDGEKVIFLGDGVPIFREKIQEMCQVPYLFAPGHVSRQRAGAVAALGAIYYGQGKTESAREHQPDYLRVSQAERERAERLKKSQDA